MSYLSFIIADLAVKGGVIMIAGKVAYAYWLSQY